MSDQAVVGALDAMASMLQVGDLGPESLTAWQARFDAAMAAAERGPGWADIAQRAHQLGKRVDLAMAGALADRDALQRELRLMAVGSRALHGYKPPRT